MKRAGTDLSSHEEQLLRYAFDEGVPLAALTDGRVWWFYLPRADAKWEQRRFCSLDLTAVDPGEAAATLRNFLDRDASVRGVTLEEAQREFEGQERDRRVRAAFSRVWRRLVTDPADPHGDMLHDLLAEAVEKDARVRPHREAVHQFLLDRLEHELTPA